VLVLNLVASLMMIPLTTRLLTIADGDHPFCFAIYLLMEDWPQPDCEWRMAGIAQRIQPRHLCELPRNCAGLTPRRCLNKVAMCAWELKPQR